MKNLTKIWVLYFLIISVNGVRADSPPNLTGDIHWTDSGGVFDPENNIFNASFNGVSDIMAAFNNGRRGEESQLGLSANTLGNLVLPSQAVWDTMTDDAKGLFIINAERVARAGMQAGVIGLPFAGIESHLDNISKSYGDILHDNDQTGHSAPSGDSGLHAPSYRIEQDPDIGSLHRTSIQYTSGSNPTHAGGVGFGVNHFYGDTFNGQGACHEFIARTENLAYFATTGSNATFIPLPLERSIYSFIYDDSGSNWGHREKALLQDETLSQAGQGWGFSNNNGSNLHEGYLSVYVRSSANYKPFPNFPSNFATLVVMNIFDPVQSPTDCHYNETLGQADTQNAPGKVPTFDVANNQWIQIAINTQPATGHSTVADILGDDIGGTYTNDWVLYAYNTSTNSYDQLSLTDTMAPGVGYWIIQATGNTVTIDMPGSSSGVYVTHTTPCASTEGCFEIPLQTPAGGAANQWQMIGYPFRDNRNADNIRIVTNIGICQFGCSLVNASLVGLVANSLWHYNGSSYEQKTNSGNTLDPWDGLWVSVLPSAGDTGIRMLIPAAN